MSWDNLIDDLIAKSKDPSGTSHIDQACIISLDGGGPWTSENHPNAFKLTEKQRANMANCFRTQDFTQFMTEGVLRRDGCYYMFLREIDGKMAFGKTMFQGALTLEASKTALVIVHTPHGCQRGYSNLAVGAIVAYLESMNM